MTAGWIAERLAMGTRGYLNHLLYCRKKLGGEQTISRTDPFSPFSNPLVLPPLRQELARRDIALAEVEAVLAAPGQIVPEHGGIVCYQSQTTCDRKPCLLRVMVNEAGESRVVVTIYRTSKISKYWQL